MKKANIVVLVSDFGSNLQALMDARAADELDADVSLVVSNHIGAFGLERAKKAGIPTRILSRRMSQSSEEYDSELADLVEAAHPDFIVLAGWKRGLTKAFLSRFSGKVINLHPALPCAYPGEEAIARAFEDYKAGKISESGVTIYLVPDEGVECGKVLASQVVPFHSTDDIELYTQRVHLVEHNLLVKTLSALITKNQ